MSILFRMHNINSMKINHIKGIWCIVFIVYVEYSLFVIYRRRKGSNMKETGKKVY